MRQWTTGALIFRLCRPGETAENGVPIGNDFTSDVRVRRAINLAIDRQAMIDHVLNGHGTIAYSVCDKMPWYSKDSEAAFDPQEAERLLEKPDGRHGADGIRAKGWKEGWIHNALLRRRFGPPGPFRGTANQLAAVWDPCDCGRRGLDTAYDRASRSL